MRNVNVESKTLVQDIRRNPYRLEYIKPNKFPTVDTKNHKLKIIQRSFHVKLSNASVRSFKSASMVAKVMIRDCRPRTESPVLLRCERLRSPLYEDRSNSGLLCVFPAFDTGSVRGISPEIGLDFDLSSVRDDAAKLTALRCVPAVPVLPVDARRCCGREGTDDEWSSSPSFVSPSLSDKTSRPFRWCSADDELWKREFCPLLPPYLNTKSSGGCVDPLPVVDVLSGRPRDLWSESCVAATTADTSSSSSSPSGDVAHRAQNNGSESWLMTIICLAMAFNRSNWYHSEMTKTAVAMRKVFDFLDKVEQLDWMNASASTRIWPAP